jgi:hypothetical protein
MSDGNTSDGPVLKLSRYKKDALGILKALILSL